MNKENLISDFVAEQVFSLTNHESVSNTDTNFYLEAYKETWRIIGNDITAEIYIKIMNV